MTIRQDKFKIGDSIWWHIPTVMEHCRSWAPDICNPTTVIAVEDITNPHLQKAAGHTQRVRIAPNYCPYGDEFSGGWFNPTGKKSHNDDQAHWLAKYARRYYRRFLRACRRLCGG